MRLSSTAFWVISLLSLTSTFAAEPLLGMPSLKINKSGEFQIDNLKFGLSYYNDRWDRTAQNSLQSALGFPKIDSTTWVTEGTWRPKGKEVPFSFTEKLEKVGENELQLTCQISHLETQSTKLVSLDVTIPLSDAAGMSYKVGNATGAFPAELKQVHLLDVNQANLIEIPTAGGTVSIRGNFSAHLQDQRQWNHEFYTFRIGLSHSNGAHFSAQGNLRIQYQPYRSQAISLEKQANRAFRDDVANDGKGGWTDQGSQNDLAMLTPGQMKAANIDFQIIDPSRNGGNSCLVLSGAKAATGIHSATLPLPSHPTFANLYLLHATAWTPAAGAPAGFIVVRYQDGSEKKISVNVGRDVRDWWLPVPLANARIGWSSENSSGPIGLYVSRFPVDPKPIAEISLQAEDKCLWMIAGITGSPDDIQFSANVSSVIAPGADWVPCDMPVTVAPGGVFDYSQLNDAPTGKYGPIIATPQGHFAFRDRPNERIKFWGVNLCFGAANDLTHAEADELAERLVRSGYNTVRLHHFDRELRDPAGYSYQFVPERLDRLDYLFAALKRRGIYINIDLYTSRRFKADELASFSFGNEVKHSDAPNWFKGAVVVSDEAFTSWKKYTENLLTHPNPYTGTNWAQDPALIGICLVNENTITNTLRHDPRLTAIFEKIFEKWIPRNESKYPGQNRDLLYNRFLLETQIDSQNRMRDYLKTIGVKALITDVNYMDTQAQVLMREKFDYVDNHVYADHPSFPDGTAWSSTSHFRQESSVRTGARVPRVIMTSRVFGKPFTVTEYDSVSVNAFRAEGSVTMPTYASLQDWDAIYRFNYASDRPSALATGLFRFFDLTSDPINLLADRVSALLFRRGDISPAKGSVQLRVDPTTALGGLRGNWVELPANFSFLGLVTRIGSGTMAPAAPWKLDAMVRDTADPTSTEGKKTTYLCTSSLAQQLIKDGVLPAQSVDADNRRYTSDTGQVVLSMTDGTMKAVGPLSESFVLPEGAALAGTFATIKNTKSFAAVQVISLDHKPLGESGRILVLHLTDSLYNGMKFREKEHRTLQSKGTLPHLIRRGAATISLALDARQGWKAWAVDLTGARQEEVPLASDGTRLLLQANTVDKDRVHLAYEIVRVKP